MRRLRLSPSALGTVAPAEINQSTPRAHTLSPKKKDMKTGSCARGKARLRMGEQLCLSKSALSCVWYIFCRFGSWVIKQRTHTHSLTHSRCTGTHSSLWPGEWARRSVRGQVCARRKAAPKKSRGRKHRHQHRHASDQSRALTLELGSSFMRSVTSSISGFITAMRALLRMVPKARGSMAVRKPSVMTTMVAQ